MHEPDRPARPLSQPADSGYERSSPFHTASGGSAYKSIFDLEREGVLVPLTIDVARLAIQQWATRGFKTTTAPELDRLPAR